MLEVRSWGLEAVGKKRGEGGGSNISNYFVKKQKQNNLRKEFMKQPPTLIHLSANAPRASRRTSRNPIRSYHLTLLSLSEAFL